jgi:hypothetical protein
VEAVLLSLDELRANDVPRIRLVELARLLVHVLSSCCSRLRVLSEEIRAKREGHMRSENAPRMVNAELL